MKKTLKRSLFVLAAAALSPLALRGAVEEVGGVAYTYSVTAGQATITSVPADTAGNLTLPQTLGGYPVTAIGDSAFEWRENLASVTIPDDVKTIGARAFRYCSALSSINLGEGLAVIKNLAFTECTNLTAATLPQTLESIGENAFENCRLPSITLPDSVTNLSYRAFYSCGSLAAAVIGSGVKVIGEEAFGSCAQLGNLQIGANVTHIGAGAFASCTSLASAAIPPSVTHIGIAAFFETARYKAISDDLFYWGDWCLGYKGTIPWRLNLRPGTAGIGAAAFSSSNLESITLPEEVLYICDKAFQSCSRLESITLGSGTRVIGEDVFAGTKWYNDHPDNVPLYLGNWCVGSKGFDIAWPVTLRAGTVGVADRAFASQDFPAITLPPSIAYIGREAFLGCWAMRRAHFQGNAPEIDGDRIYDYTQQFTTLVTEGSTGWDGSPQSAALPAAWPLTGSARQNIAFYEPFNVRITFDPNGGTVAQTLQTLESESTYGELPAPEWGIHLFQGWFTARTGGERVEAGDPVPLADITLYARWVKRYTLTLNGGTPEAAILAAGATATAQAGPAPQGWVFDRWDGAYPPGFDPLIPAQSFAMPARDVTLTAAYAKTYKNGTIILRIPGVAGTVNADLSETFFAGASQATADTVTLRMKQIRGIQTTEAAAQLLEAADLFGFWLTELATGNAVDAFVPRLSITALGAAGEPLREAALTLAVENGIDPTPAAAWQRLLNGNRAAVRITGGSTPGSAETIAETPASEIGAPPHLTIPFGAWPAAHFFRAVLAPRPEAAEPAK